MLIATLPEKKILKRIQSMLEGAIKDSGLKKLIFKKEYLNPETNAMNFIRM